MKKQLQPLDANFKNIEPLVQTSVPSKASEWQPPSPNPYGFPPIVAFPCETQGFAHAMTIQMDNVRIEEGQVQVFIDLLQPQREDLLNDPQRKGAFTIIPGKIVDQQVFKDIHPWVAVTFYQVKPCDE